MSRIGRRQLMAGATAIGLAPTETEAAARPLPAPVVLVLDRLGHRAEWAGALAGAFRTGVWAGPPEIRYLADALEAKPLSLEMRNTWDRQARLSADRYSLWSNIDTASEWCDRECINAPMLELCGIIGNVQVSTEDLPDRWVCAVVAGDAAIDLHLGDEATIWARRIAVFWCGTAGAANHENSVMRKPPATRLARAAVATLIAERMAELAGLSRVHADAGGFADRYMLHFWA